MVRLITGAAGMMGSHLYEALKDDDGTSPLSKEEVVATYHNSTLDESESITQEMVEMNILDYECVKEVLGKYKPNVIYHLAAQSRPDVSFNDPKLTLDTNIIGTTNLLQACVELENKCLFINASSSAVYGDIKWNPAPKEETICNPLSPYGTSKLAQENIVKNYHQMYGENINYVNVRIFNCTGPRKVNDLISDICRRVVNKEFPIKVGNLGGVRSIVDVRDLVKGLLLCELHVLYTKNQTFNLGGDRMYRTYEVVRQIIGDHPFEKDENLIRPLDEDIIVGNTNKAKKTLTWQPEISIEDTIFDTLDYWRTVKYGKNFIPRFLRRLFFRKNISSLPIQTEEKCGCCGTILNQEQVDASLGLSKK